MSFFVVYEDFWLFVSSLEDLKCWSMMGMIGHASADPLGA
jgi:hypothetical protein